MENSNNNLRSILMLPWLAHGHISPFLELSKRLSDRGITIYFCSTPVNLVSIEQRLTGTKYVSSRIRLVELRLPDTPDLPPHLHTTKHLPPSLIPTLIATFDLSSPAFADILSRLQPDLVIYDLLQPWAPAVTLSRGIPAVLFVCLSASIRAFSGRLFQTNENNPHGVDHESTPFPELYLRDHELRAYVEMFERTISGIKFKERVKWCEERSTGVVVIKSLRHIEAKYIDDIALRLGKKVVPVGTLLEEDHGHEQADNGKKGEIIEWLNKRSERSTVFVSFGSESSPTPEERTEIALGLEQSEVNFIWAIRLCRGAEDREATDDYSLPEALPEGFLERVKGRGYVTQAWAPQAAILSHPNTGGFLSHCGWGSVNEAMWFGVPIIAMPIHMDQHIHTRLVAEGVGFGVEVKRDRNGKVMREEVARSVKEVMVEEGGEKVRRRARELREAMQKRREMGQEDEDIDRAVDELLRICRETKESIKVEGGGDHEHALITL